MEVKVKWAQDGRYLLEKGLDFAHHQQHKTESVELKKI